jgi:hypothetical protein
MSCRMVILCSQDWFIDEKAFDRSGIIGRGIAIGYGYASGWGDEDIIKPDKYFGFGYGYSPGMGFGNGSGHGL